MHTNFRIPCIDALKAIACLLIVSHHLAFYGPMSDIAHPLAPSLIDWLYQNGRLAVQVFFVTAGFLLAGKLAPDGVVLMDQPLSAIWQRFLRLATPYWFALTAAMLCAALVHSTLTHFDVPDLPSIPQLLANIFLLQDLLHQEALSAGVWYVAIDFQLFTFSAILLWSCSFLARRRTWFRWLPQCAVLTLCALSLFVFNRNEVLDNTWLYFFGAYGLGMLTYWASRRDNGVLWLGLLTLMVVAALLLEFRTRIAVAAVTALLLGFARQYPKFGKRPLGSGLAYLGKISYSIFLIHYPLCLLVNAVFFICFPQSPAMNLVGMLVGLLVSVTGGALFFKYIENGILIRSTNTRQKVRTAP